MSKVNIPICKLNDEECNTLFNSVVDKLNIHNPRFFYPIYKKVIDEDTAITEDLKKIMLDSKFKCKEIITRLYDSEEEFFDTESSGDEDADANSDTEANTKTTTTDKKSNSESNLESNSESIQDLDTVLNQDDNVPVEEEDNSSASEFDDEELDEAIYNTYLANAVIERTNKTTGEKTLKEETIHIKKSALLDPIRVMKDEYIIPSKIQNLDIEDDTIKNTNQKLNSYNNSGHVESFFLYLGSKLVESGKCPTFPYYYGCINGDDPNYHHNITDEYDTIARTKWFKDRVKTDFDLLIIENDEEDDFNRRMSKVLQDKSTSDNDSQSGGSHSKSSSSESGNESSTDVESDAESNSESDEETDKEDDIEEDTKDAISDSDSEAGLESNESTDSNNDIPVDNIEDVISQEDQTASASTNLDFIKSMDDEDLEIEEIEITSSLDDNQESSTDPIKNPDDFDIEELSDNESLTFSDLEDNGQNTYFLRCQDMPVSLSLMEKLDNTLDNILDDDYNMSETEWFGVFFQVAFGLAVAQKYFNFVHNDLHSSNIMFKATGMKHLYFNINNMYYRIPTFGKITKIIDFARGTFKFADRWVFSDQFKEDGDAFGQYDYPVDGTLKNCENKPNPSFDMVRLGTTVIERLEEQPAVREFVEDITLDDNGNSLCYDEDTFQLYVDIAHNCHNAVPIEVIKKPVFERFKIAKNKVPKGTYVFTY